MWVASLGGHSFLLQACSVTVTLLRMITTYGDSFGSSQMAIQHSHIKKDADRVTVCYSDTFPMSRGSHCNRLGLYMHWTLPSGPLARWRCRGRTRSGSNAHATLMSCWQARACLRSKKAVMKWVGHLVAIWRSSRPEAGAPHTSSGFRDLNLSRVLSARSPSSLWC